MLIGCITGPDFETAKRQIEMARQYCDGIELKVDFDLPTNGLKIVGGEISMYHNFDETPQDLEAILKSLPPAKFYKICTMANSTCDALRMLNFVKDKPNVTGLCMGPLGQITRILSPIVQNPINYAALGLEAAPGQLQAQELIEIYNYRRLSPKTKIYGLIGNPVDHSLSNQIHNAYFQKEGIDAIYVKMPLEDEEIPQFFPLSKELGFEGLSVTRPLKEKLFDHIDVLEGNAEKIGAINTLAFEDGKVYASNTDASGALDAIEKKGPVQNRRCVILGAGGSAKAIAFEAASRGANVTVCARRPSQAKEFGFDFGDLKTLPDYDILINTTPVEEPISLQEIRPRKIVMEITVRFDKSPLMLRAKALGCQLVYGQEMFDHQAFGQYKRWFIRDFV